MKITRRELRKIIREACGDPMPVEAIVDDHLIEPARDLQRNLAYGEGEGRSTKQHLYKLSQYGAELHDMINDDDDLPEWVQSKVAVAASNIGKIKHYLEYKIMRMNQK